MVFTEFLEFVEDQFGLEVVDKLAEVSANGGAYTSVGTYDHGELVKMLVVLSETSGMEIKKLLNVFGHHLFGFLVRSYPMVLQDASNAFELLSHIDDQIHVEVRKLYPDSELPEFQHKMVSEDHMQLTYRSERGLADLAEGLLLGCFEHYGESVSLEKKDLSDGTSKVVQFDLKKT
ncbi:MAG: heme NO-binding domain-containing protein [Aureliella sp.]